MIPFSCAFVLKKFENFDSQNCRADVSMTLILRIKCAGIDKEFSDRGFNGDECMEEIVKHIKTKQKVRIDEEEMVLSSDKGNIKVVMAKSSA